MLFSERNFKFLLLGILILEGFLLSVSITGTPCHIDEAWMGEQSYREALDGMPRQELLPGMYRFEERMLIRHKLFIFLGSLTTRLSGFSLYHLRMMSVAAGIALLCLLFLYLKRENERHYLLFLLTAVILMLCPFFFRYAKLYRPECLLAACGFLSFILLRRAIDTRSISTAAFSGAAAGLAVLTHLNGIIFIASGAVLLLILRRGKLFLSFSVFSLCVASLYLYDVIGNYDLFRLQFFNDFVVENSYSGVFAPIIKLFHEHMRYFRIPEIIGISALFVVSLPAVLRRGAGSDRILYAYTGLLIVFLGLVNKSLTAKYAVPLFPFFALTAASAIYFTIKGETGLASSKIYRSLLAIFLCLYVSYGLYYSVTTAFLNRVNTPGENAEIAVHMQPGTKVLAPGRFIYNEIKRFTIIDLFVPRYLATVRNKGEFNLTSLCEYAMNHSIDYIVVDDEYRKMGGIDPRKIIPSVWDYSVEKTFSDGTILLKRFR
jgi:hypothetical protein